MCGCRLWGENDRESHKLPAGVDGTYTPQRTHTWHTWNTFTREFLELPVCNTHTHTHIRPSTLDGTHAEKFKESFLSSFTCSNTRTQCPEGEGGCQQWLNTTLQAHNPQNDHLDGRNFIRLSVREHKTHTHTQSKPLSHSKDPCRGIAQGLLEL